MIKVTFHHRDDVSDEKLKFAVVLPRYNDKWIFSRHRERSTWEIPGGHREIGEPIEEAARRELFEETGAETADITPITVYCVENGSEKTYGMLFYAEIQTLGNLPPESEMSEINLFAAMPDALTYPKIQPYLFEYITRNVK